MLLAARRKLAALLLRPLDGFLPGEARVTVEQHDVVRGRTVFVEDQPGVFLTVFERGQGDAEDCGCCDFRFHLASR
jgi:hypothetical protein